jgi:AcrR family transcriptional regulator
MLGTGGDARMSEPEPIIWMRPEKPARGPAPTYSRRQIADAAIKIADAEGIEAVSMRRVAAALDTGAMTLYRYVPNKDDLIAIMIDTVLGEVSGLVVTGDLRADLATVARSNRAVQLRHPWFAGTAVGRPMMGPNMLALNEAELSIVDGHGLGIDEMLGALHTLRAWTTGFVQDELAEDAALRRSGQTKGQWQESMGPYVRSMLETGKYTLLERVVVDAEHLDIDTKFERGLDMLLDGIEANLKKRR